MLAVGTTRPEFAYALIPLVFGAIYLYNVLRNRKTRELIDERAVDQHRRATAFAYLASLAALCALTLWTFLRDSPAADAYLNATTVLICSYAVAILWLRWRG